MKSKKPETLEEHKEKLMEMLFLLIECRDALPAIPLYAAKLHKVSLSLDKRIEDCLEPWTLSIPNGNALIVATGISRSL